MACILDPTIQQISDNDDKKYRDASLFCISFCTGARAITCSEVRLGDIRLCHIDTQGNSQVCITYNRTKGRSDWNHPVTLEGNIHVPSSGHDPVYYLNMYLQDDFGISITEMNKLDQVRSKKNCSLYLQRS